jgi:hypothetical protein
MLEGQQGQQGQRGEQVHQMYREYFLHLNSHLLAGPWNVLSQMIFRQKASAEGDEGRVFV